MKTSAHFGPVPACRRRAQAPLVPRGPAALFPAWREFFDQLAEMLVCDAADDGMGHGRAGLLDLRSSKNQNDRRDVTACPGGCQTRSSRRCGPLGSSALVVCPGRTTFTGFAAAGRHRPACPRRGVAGRGSSAGDVGGHCNNFEVSRCLPRDSLLCWFATICRDDTPVLSSSLHGYRSGHALSWRGLVHACLESPQSQGTSRRQPAVSEVMTISQSSVSLLIATCGSFTILCLLCAEC